MELKFQDVFIHPNNSDNQILFIPTSSSNREFNIFNPLFGFHLPADVRNLQVEMRDLWLPQTSAGRHYPGFGWEKRCSLNKCNLKFIANHPVNLNECFFTSYGILNLACFYSN